MFLTFVLSLLFCVATRLPISGKITLALFRPILGVLSTPPFFFVRICNVTYVYFLGW